LPAFPSVAGVEGDEGAAKTDFRVRAQSSIDPDDVEGPWGARGARVSVATLHRKRDVFPRTMPRLTSSEDSIFR